MYLKGEKVLKAITDDFYLKEFKELKLGQIHLLLRNYKTAIKYYSKWNYNNTEDSILKRNVFHNIGLCYLHLKDYKKSESFFEKEFIFIKKKDTLELISYKTDLANVYYNQYLDDDAIPLFKEAYDLAKRYSSIELKHNTSKNMAIVERNRKRYKESVAYFDEYVKWKDSIWNRDKIWELTEKDKKIAVAQKQQEVLLKEEELKREKVVRNGLLAGTSGLLVFIAGLGFFYKKLKDKNKLINQQKEALSVANATKNYLFSVVSHDLRSPINSIKRQHEQLAKHVANKDMNAVKEVTNSAIAVTESTSHLLNNVLHWSLEQSNQLIFERSSYALAPLLDQVLFDYEDIAESRNISISQDFKEGLLVNVDKESLKIVLRNLIDNAIKYMNGAGSIDVTSSKESEIQARIEIQDSGIGMTAEQLAKVNSLKDLSIDKIDRSKGVGLGLLLCQTLVKKNQGALFFESEEGKGTKAVILVSLV
ncbi:hypothetical protein WH52_03030 [Tenacibaculum holothuriorum]|uniref:histidine kinase n=2 Tax=Tenacibaculum holothuriorum TaxID=1635173 RepID=A0A1Y2PDU8_9FLAO|nr:hypothetical protein WH52_03030 [Tenacibaculum holothuriorum]